MDKECCYNVPRGTLRYGRVSCEIRPLVYVKKIVYSSSFITLHNVVIMANCSPLPNGAREGAARRNETNTNQRISYMKNQNKDPNIIGEEEAKKLEKQFWEALPFSIFSILAIIGWIFGIIYALFSD